MQQISPYALGATLYMPALHPDISDIIADRKHPELSSIVLCLEDALHESDVEAGLAHLRSVLDLMEQEKRERLARPLVFVRPRNINMAQLMSEWRGIEQVDGFVAPKVRPGNVESWMKALAGTDLFIMPTLETHEMFDAGAVAAFRDELLANDPERVLALRIGGNDLMSCLGLRRTRGTTLYESPLLYTVSMLVGILQPAGFAMTSPVCEIIDDEVTLNAELKRDIEFGLVGKTAIHPRQVPLIHEAFKVDVADLEAARHILAEDAKAVFKHNGAMCEPATHTLWARRIIERAQHYGSRDAAVRAVA